MLCQRCWTQEARVHFTTVAPDASHERAYCLACAREERLSWLLVWAYGQPEAGAEKCGWPPRRPPDVLPAGSALTSYGEPATLVALGVAHCTCGCRVAVGAELPCGHGTYGLLNAPPQLIEHVCHCGRELRLVVPAICCPTCLSVQAGLVVASAETCLWDEQRRRIVTVDHEMRRGRIGWGTFAIRN